jgi:serine/threonine-protein kinase
VSLPEIPGYELLERLGEGGMGEVFLARQLSLDREVAVKLVRRELLAEEWFLERLEREARLLARLRHPHLVTVHDFLRLPDGTAVVVMELVEGGSLRDRLRAVPNGLPLDEALTLIRQVATALAAAHAEGVVHRDIKPENVLLPGRSG